MQIKKQSDVSDVDVEKILPVFDRARKISMLIGVLLALSLDVLVFTKVLPYKKNDFISNYFFSVIAIGIGIVIVGFIIKSQMTKLLGRLGEARPTTTEEITKDFSPSLYLLSHVFEYISVFLCGVGVYIFTLCFSFPLISVFFSVK